MTTIYFIRHAQPDNSVKDDKNRPLTEKGMADCSLVTKFLNDKQIDIVLSSPYKRAVDTISSFANDANLTITTIEDFREMKVDVTHMKNWEETFRSKWENFSYSLPDSESISEVQKRNIAAFHKVLAEHKDKNIVIGTHGMALSSIINYYDPSYGFEDFRAMVLITPWVVKMVFDGDKFVEMEKIDLFRIG